ncbi:hypothetical protein GCM10009730_53810 [Streptomyces albidochromogenes]
MDPTDLMGPRDPTAPKDPRGRTGLMDPTGLRGRTVRAVRKAAVREEAAGGTGRRAGLRAYRHPERPPTTARYWSRRPHPCPRRHPLHRPRGSLQRP